MTDTPIQPFLQHPWRARDHWTPRAPAGAGERAQFDPGTGERFALVADQSAADVEAHIGDIRTIYDAADPPAIATRGERLRAMAAAVSSSAGDLGDLDARCTGKLLSEAVAAARAGAAVLDYYAALLDGDDPFREEPTPIATSVHQRIDRLPLGLVACILPFNFPVPQACARLAMLLASGNAAVFKGSELAQPPLLALEELAVDAGLPRWAFSVITGDAEAGRALTASPLVDGVCFTGGIPTGQAVAAAAARDLKRVVLELGGLTPFLVLADADLDRAVPAAVQAGFGFQGQACNAGSLLLVQKPIFDEVVDRVAAGADGLAVGHQLEEAVTFGPMISDAQRERVAELVDAALAAGAVRRTRRTAADMPPQGWFHPPTVLTDVPAGATVAREETFGPVVVARAFDDELDVARELNRSPYGLAASVWSADQRRARRLRDALRVGVVYVNCHGAIPRNAPWGGFRLSGTGRLYGRDGLYAFTEARQSYEQEAS